VRSIGLASTFPEPEAAEAGAAEAEAWFEAAEAGAAEAEAGPEAEAGAEAGAAAWVEVDDVLEGQVLRPSLSAKADIHASAEFQLIATSFVEYDPMSSV
jgi:hypothetical protein